MIAIDTTVLIDEFRAKGNPTAPVNQALIKLGGEPMLVPAVVAGEFLDGAWMVSRERAEQAMRLLRTRRVCGIDLETATIYGRLVARLRGRGSSRGGRKTIFGSRLWPFRQARPLYRETPMIFPGSRAWRCGVTEGEKSMIGCAIVPS